MMRGCSIIGGQLEDELRYIVLAKKVGLGLCTSRDLAAVLRQLVLETRITERSMCPSWRKSIHRTENNDLKIPRLSVPKDRKLSTTVLPPSIEVLHFDRCAEGLREDTNF